MTVTPFFFFVKVRRDDKKDNKKKEVLDSRTQNVLRRVRE